MTRRTQTIGTLGTLMALALVSTACERGHGIVIRLPSHVRQGAVSTDVELCQRTTPRFVMDRPDVGGDPTLDVAMVPTDEDCVWALPQGTEVQRGVYTLLVRFDTKLNEATDCGPVDTPIVIGAYAKKAISFPFPESFNGFTDDQFRSRATDEVPNYPELRFDTDSDGRDNLAEVQNDGDPCKGAAPVTIALTPESTGEDEGTGIALVIESTGDETDAYEVVVAFTHENGAAVGTQTASFTVRSDSGALGVVTDPPASEGWSIEPGNSDELPAGGSGRWRIVFTGDEPFVGPVRALAQARLDAENVLATAAVTLSVGNVDDPTIITDADGAPLDVLLFGERVAPEPYPNETDEQYQERILVEMLADADARLVQISDDDVDDDVTTWQAALVAAECPALSSIERVPAGFEVRWAPRNADAAAESNSGEPASCTIQLFDGDDVAQSTALARFSVSPLRNDSPLVVPPTPGSLGMPRVQFAEHQIPFVVVDPDEIAAPPTCAVTLTARAGTPCTQAEAFPGADGVVCEVNGVRNGAQWPFTLALRPGADYFSVCGDAPSFDLALTITDVSPDGSDAPLTAEMCSDSGAENCIEAMFLRTSDVVATRTLDLGEGYYVYDDYGPLIDGARRLALIRSYDATAAERTLSIADIGADPPVIVARAPAGGHRTFEEGDGARRGAVDEVNGRFITIGRDAASNLEVLIVTYGDDPANATWQTYTPDSQCDEPYNDRVGAFLADAAGNLYIMCIGASDNSPPPRLVRFNGAGQRTSVNLANTVHPNNDFGWEGEHIAVVKDPTTQAEWMVWPDSDGVVAIELATVGGTLNTVHLDVPFVGNADLDAHAVIPGRGMYLFAHEVDTDGSGWVQDADNDDAILRAIVFDDGPVLSPNTLALPEMSASNYNGFSRMRLVARAFDPVTPVDEPDLFIEPGYGSYPLVDLDTFTVVDSRLAADFPAYWSGLHESPDRRFAVGAAGCEEPDYGHVLLLFPWDQSPTQTLSLDSNCANNEQPEAATFSASGDIGVWIDGDGDAWIFDFVEAAAGQD